MTFSDEIFPKTYGNFAQFQQIDLLWMYATKETQKSLDVFDLPKHFRNALRVLLSGVAQ